MAVGKENEEHEPARNLGQCKFHQSKRIIVRENTLLPKHVGVKCIEVAIIHLERMMHLCQQLDAPQLAPVESWSVTPAISGCTTYENFVRHLSPPLDNLSWDASERSDVNRDLGELKVDTENWSLRRLCSYKDWNQKGTGMIWV